MAAQADDEMTDQEVQSLLREPEDNPSHSNGNTKALSSSSSPVHRYEVKDDDSAESDSDDEVVNENEQHLGDEYEEEDGSEDEDDDQDEEGDQNDDDAGYNDPDEAFNAKSPQFACVKKAERPLSPSSKPRTSTIDPNPQPLPQTQPLIATSTSPSWFAADPSKAYYEKLSLTWAPLSMALLLLLILGTPIYKHCDRNTYLLISVVGCLPGFLLPILFPCPADRARPLHARFWVKGTLWIAIFGFYGNYFWTHYFYSLLGAEYLFDSYRFNDVPVVTFTCTFFYFTFYFSFVNVILRRVAYCTSDFPTFGRALVWWCTIVALSYGTAVFEAVSVQHFPLYTYKQRDAFLLIGSVVYGLYFIVGFPMFFALDETPLASAPSPPQTYAFNNPSTTTPTTTVAEGNTNTLPSSQPPLDTPSPSQHNTTHSLQDATISALAATAIVTLLLDLWRLFLGSIYELSLSSLNNIKLPFIYQQRAIIPSTPIDATPSATPSPSIVYVMKEVTPDACVALAKTWARTKVQALRSVIQS